MKRTLGLVTTVAAICASVVVGGVMGHQSVTVAHAQGMSGQQTNANTTPAAGSVPNTITVTGAANLSISNLMLSLQLNYNITDGSVTSAIKDESTLQQKLTQALTGLGYNSSEYQFSEGIPGVGNQMPNTTMSLNINIKNQSQVKRVIQHLFSIMPGYVSNVYSNVQPFPTQTTLVRTQLFNKALADAKSQANILAQDSGEQVGPVISIQVNQPSNNYMPFGMKIPNNSYLGGYSIMSNGNDQVLDVTTQITVTYELLK